MSNQMNEEQFKQIMDRFEKIDQRFEQIDNRFVQIEADMVKKSDVFQAVMTVQGFTFAIIIGVIVALNALIGFA